MPRKTSRRRRYDPGSTFESYQRTQTVSAKGSNGSGLLWGVLGILALALLCGFSSYLGLGGGLHRGSIGVLNGNQSYYVPIISTRDFLDDHKIAAYSHSDWLADQEKQLNLIIVPKGTRVKVLETDLGVMQVSVLAGEHAGEFGWIYENWIEPESQTK